MDDLFAGIAEAVAAARSLWSAAAGADIAADGYDGADLMALSDAVAGLRRRVEAAQAHVAAQVSRASRGELGSAGFARQQGYRNARMLLSATSGMGFADAVRLISVGEAIEPRMTLTGEEAPARHPHVGEAMDAGALGLASADAVITMLDRVAIRAGHSAVMETERTLVEQAPGLSLEQFHKVIRRAEAYLDPDGVEPREEQQRAKTGVTIRQRDGMIHLNGVFDAETGAPIVTALDAMVGIFLSTGADRADEGDGNERRSIPRLRAEALAILGRHALECDSRDVRTGGATVVVRVDADQLQSGIGHATIDGIDQPVSIATARRMAAAGGVIPCVLDGRSEILDFGRRRRLFSPAQKLALTERDGGCAKCGLPPWMAEVHHIRWWDRDAGPTDLDNGILLCGRCHHLIHDERWGIRIGDKSVRAKVWFIPPAHVDPRRTPRLGGRARFDHAVA